MYKQLIMPLVASSAIASYCLLYVDNTINAPQQYRTANAQIAHNQAKEKIGCMKIKTTPKMYGL